MMKLLKRCEVAILGVCWAPVFAHAEQAGTNNPAYNMPPAVGASMGVADAMKKMETVVMPSVFEAFKTANPAPLWLFGEDRQLWAPASENIQREKNFAADAEIPVEPNKGWLLITKGKNE